jgi:hypothetical protein
MDSKKTTISEGLGLGSNHRLAPFLENAAQKIWDQKRRSRESALPQASFRRRPTNSCITSRNPPGYNPFKASSFWVPRIFCWASFYQNQNLLCRSSPALMGRVCPVRRWAFLWHLSSCSSHPPIIRAMRSRSAAPRTNLASCDPIQTQYSNHFEAISL